MVWQQEGVMESEGEWVITICQNLIQSFFSPSILETQMGNLHPGKPDLLKHTLILVGTH